MDVNEITEENIYEEHPVHHAVYTTLWACPRQLTGHWGCPTILQRMYAFFGEKPDIYFGLTDGIDDPDAVTVDIDPRTNPTIVADWGDLPFEDKEFEFAFWDPPYDKRYDQGLKEILRVTKRRVAILHQIVYPQSPILSGWTKTAIIGIMPIVDDYEVLLPVLSGLFDSDGNLQTEWIERAKNAVTTGPNMRIRCLQVYDRVDALGPLRKRKKLSEVFSK